MLDIRFVRENKELVETNNASRNVNIDLADLISRDDDRLNLQKKVEALRSQRNARSKTRPTEEEIALIRKLGDEIADLENLADEKIETVNELLVKIPNINHATTPLGKNESENVVAKTVGQKPVFDFAPKEHFDVSSAAQYIDLERGAKVAGSRFYFLKDKLAILERAIMQYALDIIIKKGFTLMLPPILVKEDAMFGTGFFPADKKDVYSVNPTDDNLYLIGTSEVPLVYYHSDEILEETDLPKRYVAISPCFRRESGSYGKDTKGLFRVHQFYKVEMVVLVKPEESWKYYEDLLAIEEEFITSLGLHYQVMNVCSGDLGYPAAKKYDCESWFPGQEKYRELTSTSNTTDYQSRRSNIKYKTKDGKKDYVHTLNGTVSSDRPMLAIIENFQTSEGKVVIPEVLRRYTGFDTF